MTSILNKLLAIHFTLGFTIACAAAPVHRCAADALAKAAPLLAFHAGADAGSVDVDDTAKALAAIRNPVDRRQSFDVLEVQGHVYRADYRLRFIYASIAGRCVLMGQEVLELSRP